MENKKGGMSDADNEMAGRFLLMAVFAIVGVVFLILSPVLIGGFLIGLIWYGAYMADGEPNGEKLAWPIAITMSVLIYCVGLFPPLGHYFPGVLFADFGQWTGKQVWDIIGALNQMLPKKFMIRNITVEGVRLYSWSLIPVAAASFTYLHFKGAGRGVFIYRALHTALMPLRWLAVYSQWVFGLGLAIAAVSVAFNVPYWFRTGFGFLFLNLSAYILLAARQSRKTSAQMSSAVSREEAILLGHEKGKPHKKISLTNEQLNHHVHIVGASGFGKSVLLSHVISERIKSGSGLLFVDLKADFETIRQVVSHAKASGRMGDLYIFSCGNPEMSSPYNVVATGTANQLKDRIMGALNWSEEFYKNEAASFLLKLLRGLCALRDLNLEKFDLGAVLKCAEDPRSIEHLIDQLPVDQVELRSGLEGLVSHLGRAENYKALQGLRSQLEALLLSDFGHLLKASAGGIDLFEAIRSRKVIYVLLDSRTYGESSRALGKLILQDLKAASARIDNEIPREQRTPFSVVIDEFADMASEDFVGFLDRARSSQIGVVVAHQEIADLSRISPEFTRRLMNSTSTLFAFLQKLPDSSELIAGIAGTRKTKEVTEQAKSNWLFGDEKTGMKSIKEVDEFLIHPNIIRSLSVGECVMVTKYPQAKSALIKVRPEATSGYLSAETVRAALLSQAQRGQDGPQLPKAMREQTVAFGPTRKEEKTLEKPALMAERF
jgi:type IV secretory pathway TraG/TraD family ATPase VirD4